MAGNANLIEKTMQLADDGRDLRSKIAGVHRDERDGRRRQCSLEFELVKCRLSRDALSGKESFN